MIEPNAFVGSYIMVLYSAPILWQLDPDLHGTYAPKSTFVSLFFALLLSRNMISSGRLICRTAAKWSDSSRSFVSGVGFNIAMSTQGALHQLALSAIRRVLFHEL